MILAVEPMPVTFVYLRWNLLANQIPLLAPEDFRSSRRTPRGGVLPINAGATSDGRDISIEYSPSFSGFGTTSASAFDYKIPNFIGIHAGVARRDLERLTRRSLNVTGWLHAHDIDRLAFLKMDCEVRRSRTLAMRLGHV